MIDGVYQVRYRGICAGFVIEHGELAACSPILRKRFSFFKTIAIRIGANMGCRTIDLGGGVTVIACDRGRKRAQCTACKEREHDVLCDFPLAGAKAGKTCDVRLCKRCAVHVGDDRDYCPPHARVAEAQHKAAAEHGGDTIEARLRAWCGDHFVDVEDVLELWNERAAIREHDGTMPKWAAERLAFEDVIAHFS